MKNRSFLSLVLVLLFVGTVFGQNSFGGYPLSYFAKDLPTAKQIDIKLPDSIRKIIKADTINDKWHRRVAFAINTDINLADDGVWSKSGNGDVDNVCRLILRNEGAVALGLKFENFEIHNEGQLFVYNEDMSELLGSFNRGNNGREDLLTDCIKGESVVIEFNGSLEDAANIKISEVIHFYKNIEAMLGSDACEVNVMCPEGQNYRQQMKSVVQILTKVRGGYFNCSGTLVNNTAKDKTPYILTAFHCAHDTSGNESLESDYSDWRFMFNYQYDNCDGTNPAKNTKVYGASLVASADWKNSSQIGTDFLLLKLNEPIPSDVDVFYCGWDRSGVVKSNGVAMHHPQGDYKKISTFNTSLAQSNYPNGGLQMSFWSVKWAKTVSGYGVTEGGSSGCGLLSSDGLLIGTLTGGRSSCNNLGGADYFGMFSKSWESNGTDPSKRLSPWLDPIGSGTYTLHGLAGDNSIEEFDGVSVNIYPNPASEYVIVELPDGLSLKGVSLIDVTGRTIYVNYEINGNKLSVHTDGVKEGLYVLKLNFNNRYYRTGKVSIVR